MSVKKLINKGFALILLFAVIGCDNEATNDSANQKSKTEPKIQNVEVVTPKSRSFTTNIHISGTAKANQAIQLYSMVSGTIASVHYDIGDVVQKGAVLARISNPKMQQLELSAIAQIEREKANIARAEANLVSAKAAYQAKLVLGNRMNEIAELTPGLTSRMDVEVANEKMEMANANVAVAEAEIRAAKASLNSAQAELNGAKVESNFLQVRAPFSGVIVNRMIDIGSSIQSSLDNPNSHALYSLEEVNPIKVAIPVPESDASLIQKGMKVSVHFPEIAAAPITAEISRIAGSLDAAKTMMVEIDIDNSKNEIMPGMYAKVEIPLKSRENVLSLPIVAQYISNDDYYLLNVGNDNIVNQIELKKGLANNDFFEVLNAAITKDSRLIITGKNLVKNGQKVNPIIQKNN